MAFTFIRKSAFVTALLLGPLLGGESFAVDWTNGSALTGTPRLPQNFANFPYVNPQAPKGGTVRQGAPGSFDSFNDQITRGEAAPGLNLTYETLMEASLDELDISSQYGLLAEATKYPDDFSSVSFRLNPKAKWHDGELGVHRAGLGDFGIATRLCCVGLRDPLHVKFVVLDLQRQPIFALALQVSFIAAEKLLVKARLQVAVCARLFEFQPKFLDGAVAIGIHEIDLHFLMVVAGQYQVREAIVIF